MLVKIQVENGFNVSTVSNSGLLFSYGLPLQLLYSFCFPSLTLNFDCSFDQIMSR